MAIFKSGKSILFALKFLCLFNTVTKAGKIVISDNPIILMILKFEDVKEAEWWVLLYYVFTVMNS